MKKLIVLLILTALALTSCGNAFYGIPTGTAMPEQDTTYATGATVTVGSETTHYADVTEAWTQANSITDESVTVKLFQDWIADCGDFGKHGGKGFTDNGSLLIETRGDAGSEGGTARSFTLDLNCHTLDGGVGKAGGEGTNRVADRSVITAKCGEVFVYCGLITIKNGTVKGGCATLGGGIYIEKRWNDVILQNLTITGNYALESGGGVAFEFARGTLKIIDCTITDNASHIDGAGVYTHNMRVTWADPYVDVSGKVIIKDNFADGKASNLQLYNFADDSLPYDDYKLSGMTKLTSGSEIGISFECGNGMLTNEIEDGLSSTILSYLKADKGSITHTVRSVGCDDYYTYYVTVND